MDLRCYGHLSTRRDRRLSLQLPDLDSFDHTWDIEADLPWSALTPLQPGEAHPDQLDPTLVQAISKLPLPLGADPRASQSCVAFLYLYMSLVGEGAR